MRTPFGTSLRRDPGDARGLKARIDALILERLEEAIDAASLDLLVRIRRAGGRPLPVAESSEDREEFLALVLAFLRRLDVPQLTNHSSLIRMRKELSELITKTLRRGIKQGIWSDANPELTAIIIPGMLRSAMLYGPRELDQNVLTQHILRLVYEGIGKGNCK